MGSSEFTIREARQDDFERLAPLVTALCEEEGKASMNITGAGLAALLHDSGVCARVLVAEAGAEVVGYVVFYPVVSLFRCEPVTLVENLYVRPAYRGFALGKKLMAAVAAQSLREGRRRLELNVRSDNAKAVGFYERLGLTAPREEVLRIEDSALQALASACGEGVFGRGW